MRRGARVRDRLLRLCAAIGLLLGGGLARAQGPVTVSGIVEDAAGEPLEGARLSLSGGAGEIREAVSDVDGHFSFDDLPPGPYVLRVEARPYLPLDMTVEATEAPRPLRIQMKVGLAEEVSVTGVSPGQERTAAGNNADALDFVGDLIAGLPAPSGGNGLLDSASAFLSPAAQGTDGVSILVDGADSSGLTIPGGSVRRIRINRDPYSAEYRRPGKGRIEVVTEDGSRRRFKGSAAFGMRTSALDARNALSPNKPKQDQRLFELSFGGPLRKGSSSFFVGLEHETDEEQQIVNARTSGGPLNLAVLARDSSTAALGRLDFRPGLHRVGLRYDFSNRTDTNRGVGGFRLPEQGYDSRRGPQHTFQASARSIFSAGYVNDARLTLVLGRDREGLPAEGPALGVNGAFVGGDSQVYRLRDSRRLEFRDVSTLVFGAHALRFGGGFRREALDGTDASGFGGVFEFASLDDFEGGTPYVYRLSQGTPDLSAVLWEVEGFLQDEIKLGKDLHLSAGVRYDWTSEIGDRDNFSPRLALAYSPGTQKSVYRAGFGVFYERLPLGVSERRRLDDGVRVRKVVITEPSYPDPFRAGQVTEVPSSIFRTAADFQTPYLIQASAAWERQIARRSLLTLEYAFLRGLHLFRVRDVNAPLPGSGLRPDPSRSNVLEVESTGRMDGHALTLTYRGRVGGRVTVTAQYTLARTRNDLPGADSSADFPFELPADNYDLSGEYGRADFDRRHRLDLAALLELPLETRIGAMLSVKSGEPFDVTTGRDDNGDSYARDRPPGVPRNSGRGPGFARLDLRLTKTVRAASPFRGGRRSGGQFQLVADVFNVLNKVNYGQYVGVMTSPFFGRPNVAKDPRRFQLALRYSF